MLVQSTRLQPNGCTTVSTSRCRLFSIESKQTNLYSSHGNTRFAATHKASSILTVTNPSQRQTEIQLAKQNSVVTSV